MRDVEPGKSALLEALLPAWGSLERVFGVLDVLVGLGRAEGEAGGMLHSIFSAALAPCGALPEPGACSALLLIPAPPLQRLQCILKLGSSQPRPSGVL